MESDIHFYTCLRLDIECIGLVCGFSLLALNINTLWDTLGRTVQVQCCFTSPETIRTIRDGEPRTATSTFTQLLSSELVQFNVALRPLRP